MNRRRLLTSVAAVGAVTGLAACAGGGPSDIVGGAAADSSTATATVDLYAYAVPKVGFDAVIPAFQATPAGRGVEFRQSYGASGDQSRKVAAGARADVVSFSVEPDVTRLVEAGLVAPGWNAGPRRGIPFGSVVTLVVRAGNPQRIADWADLLRPGVEVVTPNPFSSGSARWNLLAPYAALSRGGMDRAPALAYLRSLLADHVRVQPKSGREATEAFLQGSGDVLLSYENEALFLERSGEPVAHVTPPQTVRIENPVAVVTGASSGKSTSAAAGSASAVAAFVDYLYSPPAQRLWAAAGFRPVDEGVAAEFTADFPEPERQWTVADLGGWAHVDATLFAKDGGAIATIYDAANA